MRDDSPWDCLLIAKAKQNKDLIVNPIYQWTDADVWDFIRGRGMKYNPLYDQGWKRVGCVGCPMATNQLWEFDKYPKYKELYIKAFQRMIERRKEKGKINKNESVWISGESVFKWWTKDYREIEGQMSIFDLEERT